MGYSPWGLKESDTTEATEHARTQPQAGVPKISNPDLSTFSPPPHIQNQFLWDEDQEGGR